MSPLLEQFLRWLGQLTLIDFILILWPLIIIDFLRSLIKATVLLSHALYLRLFKRKTPVIGFLPKVSIIIPAHNEEKVISRSIEAAIEAEYPNKEIVVVDDGSTDGTYRIALQYAKKGKIKLLHRDVASGSKAGALNYGLMFATGDIIITVDADTILERDAIKEAVKTLLEEGVSAVSGNVRVLSGEKGGINLLVKLQAYEYLLALELGRRFNSIIGTLLIISGAFGAFWRKYIESLGRYDLDTITEDFDVTVKMRKLNKKLVFSEKAVAWTFVPETLRDWIRQRIRWTRGQAETLWKHRNVLLKQKFNIRFVLAVYDMIFMDVILLFIRLAWLMYVIFFFHQNFIYIFILITIIYLAIELMMVTTAVLLSPRKQDLKNIYLAPIVAFIYRPFYSLIRFKAYFDWLLKRKSRW
ncbi:MAG: glycosyltransferase [Candidatus Bathyarchaeia archaeon]